jgi:hypothetical protein
MARACLPEQENGWLPSLHPRHADWELVIAGPDEGGHLEHVQALARELQLPRLVWHPPVFGEAKSAAMKVPRSR